MKSKKAEEYLFENGLGYPYTGYVTEPVAERAAELAEQEAEERMRKKAIKAFCYFVMEYHCKEAICSKRNKCDASCVIAQYFIQKLTENENDD